MSSAQTRVACLTCGASFLPRASGGKPQVRCSAKCRRKTANANYIQRNAPTLPVSCADCGGSVVQSGRGRPRRYCSDVCKRRVTSRKMNRRRLPVAQPKERACAYCGRLFVPKRDARYCYYNWCVQRAYTERKGSGRALRMIPHRVVCKECGDEFVAIHPEARWCGRSCQIRHRSRVASRRRGPSGVSTAYIDREIFDRDRWCCHICGEVVRQDVPRTHKDGATIDHVVPLSLGGADEPANVATAHGRCNRAKSAKVLAHT